MSVLVHLEDDFAPAPIVRARPEPPAATWAGHARFRRTAAAPLQFAIVATAISAVAYWIPELGLASWGRVVVEQVQPLVSLGLVTLGGAPAPLPEGGATWGPLCFLLGAFVLSVCAHEADGYRRAVLPAAAVTVVGAVWSLVSALAAGQLVSGLAGVLALAASVWFAIATARRSPRFVARTPSHRSRRAGLLWLYLLLLPLPLAVGRAVAARDLRDRAAELQLGGSPYAVLTLVSWATPLCLLVGALLGIAVWAALRAMPPWERVSGFVGRAVTAVALVAVAFGLVVPSAAVEAARTDETTRTSAPPSAGACGRWSDPADDVRSLAIGGDCDELLLLEGYGVTAATPLEMDAGTAGGATTPEGEYLTAGPYAAVYDPVLVVAGTSEGSDASDGPDVVAAYGFADAGQGWRFRCPDEGAFSIRFAGAAEGDPDAGVWTTGDEPDVVLVGCSDAVYRVDARTGALV